MTVYRNGTIRLPKSIVRQLRLESGQELILKVNGIGFAVCKMEHYSDWKDKFEEEIQAADDDMRRSLALLKRLFKVVGEDEKPTMKKIPTE